MKEQWKDIPDYVGDYQGSTLGRIKSLDRVDCSGRNLKGIVLKQSFDGGGYLNVTLSKNGKIKTINVHKLIYKTFKGKLSKGFEIDHDDNFKTNNRLDNLKLLTSRANVNKHYSTIKTTSIYPGVDWNKGANKWRARISKNKVSKLLGYFDIETDARDAYINAL